jgi:Protein of unknown function (DUF4054)
MSSPPVTFDYPTWIATFPEFSPLSSGQGQAYFNRATGSFAANACSNPAFGDGRLPYLLYLATSHVAWLSCPKDENGDPSATGEVSPLTGRINSATEGSVSVQTEFETGGDTNQLLAYLDQTKYGQEYAAAIANYRTARYLARPTIVVNGAFPGIFSPGLFRRF